MPRSDPGAAPLPVRSSAGTATTVLLARVPLHAEGLWLSLLPASCPHFPGLPRAPVAGREERRVHHGARLWSAAGPGADHGHGAARRRRARLTPASVPPRRLLSDTSNPPASRPQRNDSIPRRAGPPAQLRAWHRAAPAGAPVRLPARDPPHVPGHGERGDRRPAHGELPASPAPAVAVPRGRLHAGAMGGHHGLAAQERRLAGRPPPLPPPPPPSPPRATGSRRIPGQSAFRLACADLLGKSHGPAPAPRGAGHSAPRAPGRPGRPACQKPCLFTQRSPKCPGRHRLRGLRLGTRLHDRA